MKIDRLRSRVKAKEAAIVRAAKNMQGKQALSEGRNRSHVPEAEC